jgi:hypothetical protein
VSSSLCPGLSPAGLYITREGTPPFSYLDTFRIYLVERRLAPLKEIKGLQTSHELCV